MSQEATLLEIRELEAEYEILGELGRGGMAVVYLARDRELGRQVAIKVIHTGAGTDEEAVGRQLIEARTVAQLQHPNVAAIYAVKRLSTLGLALVMQYVPGRTLERAMREDGAFAHERTEAVLTDVAAALAYAHARGVVHRDIKPDNIFLNDETGRALVSDFGIALSAEFGRHQAADMIVGTPAYMSPEQIDGLEIDGRSDVFSLGLIGYEMIAGVRPWVEESVSDVMYRQKFEALPSIAEVRPDTPDRLRVAVERALAKDREDRWPSAGTFLAALTDDEWVPEERGAASGPDTADRVAVYSGPRSPSAPASTGVPLDTMQYRRDAAPTPRRGFAVSPRRPRRTKRRMVAIGLPLMLAAGVAVAAVMRNPGLLTQYGVRLTGWTNDSTARVQTAMIAALRDSAARAFAAAGAAARRAADSAAAATSTADSSADLRLTAARDSLFKAQVEARKTKLVPSPAVPATVAIGRDVTGPLPHRDTAIARPAPAPELAPIHPPSAPTVVAGGTHTCALAGDGGITCWGGNDRGQLGVGTTARKPSPTHVAGDPMFVQVSAGISHSCAVARTGAVYCWGDNSYGQLGDSGGATQLSPIRVAGTHTFRAVATGTTHSCGLTAAGEVWCWGRNLYGQLGNGSTQDQFIPVRVESSAHFVALSAGWNHSCALDDVGHASCWGQNGSGQLGDGTTIVRAVPAAVGGDLIFRTIAAGGSHTCALTVDGDAYCWGRGNAGQLGTGDGREHSLPAKVAATVTFVSITAGSVHSCALTHGGEAYCWGRNTFGQLGDGTTTERATPVRVGNGLLFVSIHASGAHTCGTSSGGGIYCWGDNSDGQIGDGTTTDRSDPVPVSGAP